MHYICGAFMFAIRFGPDAKNELGALKVFDRRKIFASVRRELTTSALVDKKPRKRLAPAPESGIETGTPVWQLRVGDFRIFYDVSRESSVVMIQRIVRKGRK